MVSRQLTVYNSRLHASRRDGSRSFAPTHRDQAETGLPHSIGARLRRRPLQKPKLRNLLLRRASWSIRRRLPGLGPWCLLQPLALSLSLRRLLLGRGPGTVGILRGVRELVRST